MEKKRGGEKSKCPALCPKQIHSPERKFLKALWAALLKDERKEILEEKPS